MMLLEVSEEKLVELNCSQRMPVVQMGIRDFGRYEIPFNFNGNSVILKVTKFSTCDDVIHMVLHKDGLPVTKVAFYAMVERTSSLERTLSGKTLVYKVWRSWGCERNHFEFHIKSKESKLGFKRSVATISSESGIDELFLDHYNKKAENYKDHSSHSGGKNVSFNIENDSKSEIITPRKDQSASSGKQIVMARYMYDLFKRSSRKKKTQTILPGREKNVGTENKNVRCIDGNDDTNISQREKCSYFWNKYYFSDSESEAENSFSDTSSEDSFRICNSETSMRLDTAFVKSSFDSDSDEGIDVTSMTSVDLDTAFVDELECNHGLKVTYDINRSYTHKRDTISEEQLSLKDNEIEMNISDDRFLKELFGKAGNGALTSEDDEMDSFMRSRLDSF